MKKLWNSDIQFDIDKVRKIIEHDIPDLSIHDLHHLGEGWDNTLYLINHRLIIRFAHREMVIPFVNTEIRALPQLLPFFTCPIPRILHTGHTHGAYPYLTYDMIPGEIAADLQLSDKEKEPLTTPVVDFLNELYTLQITPGLQDILPGDTIGRLDLAKRFGQIRDKIGVTETLGLDFKRTIPEELALRITQEDVGRTRCAVHGDLYARNILIRDRNTLSGVIDWTDVHIGHPAKDFAFALSFFDPPLLAQVMDRCLAFNMTTFYLAAMAAISHTCHLAEYAIDIENKGLQEECRTAFRNIQDNYIQYSGNFPPPIYNDCTH